MFGETFKRKYALTDKGVKNVKKGTFWTVIVNIVVMGGVSVLYLLMRNLTAILVNDQTEIKIWILPTALLIRTSYQEAPIAFGPGQHGMDICTLIDCFVSDKILAVMQQLEHISDKKEPIRKHIISAKRNITNRLTMH